jgi:Cu+-exporting ATPase
MKQKFNVTGMTCAACQSHVEKDVSKVEGVNTINVNLLSNSMVVEYDETKTSASKIIEAVKHGGYGASIQNEAKTEKKTSNDLLKDELAKFKVRVIISFIFLIPLLYIAMGPMINLPLPNIIYGKDMMEILGNGITFGLVQFLLLLPILYVNFNYFKIGFKRLFKLSPNMDSLIAIGTTAAIVYSLFAIMQMGQGLAMQDWHMVEKYHMNLYFEAGGTILTLVTLGKYLEMISKGKTSEAIEKLINLAPKTALRLVGDDFVEVLVDEVKKDDILLVKPGMSVPLDGVIIEGASSIDQSAITGESIPVEKTVGDKVIGATINKTGSFKFKVEKTGDDTVLAQIIKLVEEASNSKAPISKLADKISGVFVPVVIGIALISFIVWLLMGSTFEFAMTIAISILVISCPCALGLATPVAIMVGTGKGAENGILIKSAESLEIAHQVKTVVLDKTGTITMGKPQVSDIITFNNLSEKELLKIAGSLEKLSEHPLASSVLEKTTELNIKLVDVTDFNSISGQGVIAKIDNNVYYAGNLKLMENNGIDIKEYLDISNQLALEGKTPLYFASSTKLLGIIAVMDMVKPNSKKAIEQFHKMGIDVVMLTGDNKITAEAIKKQLNINQVIAEVLPQDKEKVIREIQGNGKKVAMIGDGINDAPALVRADVGVAIGAGTDIALESADIILMKSDLLDAVTAIQLSHKTINNIKMNLFWAFIYNIIGIPVAAGVFYYSFNLKLNPMIGALAMSFSSVSVVLNALRLRFFKAKYK